MKRKSWDLWTIVTTTLVLLAGSLEAHAEIVPLYRLRDVLAFTVIQPIEGESAFDSDQIQTQDPGNFDETLDLELTLGDARAAADVFQTSQLENGEISAFGGFSSGASLGTSAEFAEALGTSRLIYRFSVTAPVTARLFGTLSASGNGVATAVLTSPTGVLLNLTVTDDVVGFAEDLVLGLGTHELSVTAGGYGQALPSGENPAAGNFEVFLDPDAPASVEPVAWSAAVPQVLPNPIVGEAEVRFRGLVPVGRSLNVVAADGRIVRHLGVVSGERMRWDTRDDRGTLLPAGVYFVKVEGTGATARALVVR